MHPLATRAAASPGRPSGRLTCPLPSPALPPMQEVVELLPSRIRRRFSRGITRKHTTLLKKLRKAVRGRAGVRVHESVVAEAVHVQMDNGWTPWRCAAGHATRLELEPAGRLGLPPSATVVGCGGGDPHLVIC